jgi:hypothetical protein
MRLLLPDRRSMFTEISNAVRAADREAQYDEKAKRLLGNKQILAHILAKTVDEFKGMNPRDIIPYIEGEPYIGVIPIEPGLTNSASQEKGQRVVGFNTENEEINEGIVRFDIVFYVRMKDGISQIIVNVEAQKDEPTEYYILNRSIFYISRLVSSQKERDFLSTQYNDIKRVFSIWICMNMEENTLNYVHLTDENLLGTYSLKGSLDLLNIVFIGISEKLPERDEKYELHRLLSALLSRDLPVNEKLNIMKTEYNIQIEDNMRKDVNTMCNLGQGIREEGEAIGEARGRAIGEANIIRNMYKKGFTIEQISDATDKGVEEVSNIIEKSRARL